MIGTWVKRQHGKWHFVESVIDGDAITRCGRRMGGPQERSEVTPLTRMIDQPQLCHGGCQTAA